MGCSVTLSGAAARHCGTLSHVPNTKQIPNRRPRLAVPGVLQRSAGLAVSAVPDRAAAVDTITATDLAPSSLWRQATGAAVSALFNFPPFFKFATKQARAMIKSRAESIDIDWEAAQQRYAGIPWEDKRAEVKLTEHPEYYCRPFHAYPEGNLGWTPAHEVEVAAMSVHSTVFAPSPALDKNGDARLRRSYSECMGELLERHRAVLPKDIIDIGCATGLSSVELAQTFPDSRVTGVDLSEYFLAVGRWNQTQLENKDSYDRITFLHAQGEATGLQDGCADLVSVCLVYHELPRTAAVEVMKEAYRLLRPGGAMAIMDMNPKSEAFKRVLNNTFAFTAFKSTEPYLDEYMSLDIHAELAGQGFKVSDQLENSPKHRTIVAIK